MLLAPNQSAEAGFCYVVAGKAFELERWANRDGRVGGVRGFEFSTLHYARKRAARQRLVGALG